MEWRRGEQLRCSNPDCRLQVMVIDLGTGIERQGLLLCPCGSTMKRSYEAPAVSKTALPGGRSGTDVSPDFRK